LPIPLFRVLKKWVFGEENHSKPTNQKRPRIFNKIGDIRGFRFYSKLSFTVKKLPLPCPSGIPWSIDISRSSRIIRIPVAQSISLDNNYTDPGSDCRYSVMGLCRKVKKKSKGMKSYFLKASKNSQKIQPVTEEDSK